MITVDDLRAGDIFFALVRSPIGMQMPAVVQCPYSHILVYLGNQRTVDAAPGGVRLCELTQEFLSSFAYIDVFRFEPAECKSSNLRFTRFFCQSLENAVGTLFLGPYHSIFVTMQGYIRAKVFRRNLSHRKERVPDRPKRVTCASLISWAIHEAARRSGNIELSEARGSTMRMPTFEPWNRTTWMEIREKLIKLRNQDQQYRPQRWTIPQQSLVTARQYRSEFLATLGINTPKWGPPHYAGCLPSDLIWLSGMRWIDELDMVIYQQDEPSPEITVTINAGTGS